MRAPWILASSIFFLACSNDGAGPAGPEPSTPHNTAGSTTGQPGGTTTTGTTATGTTGTSAGSDKDIASRTSDLQWKRYATFEADLAGALGLPPDEMCREFGEAPCIREVHLTPLGGNEPFKSGLLKPTQEPLATTPTVIDRIVLAACAKRVDLDAAESAGMFGEGFALQGDAPAPDSEGSRKLVTALYRRLLARDPIEDEAAIVAGLARDDSGAAVAAADFAKAACFAVGTTTEFLFF